MSAEEGIEKVLSYRAKAEDEGCLVRQLARTKLGLSHHQFTSAKFREGGVTVDGRKAFATDPVHAGETLCVRLREPGRHIPQIDRPVPVLYEDDDLYVIAKPAPLPTQSSERQTGDTLEARMGGERVFRPVNRLDKGTSGLLLAAKHAQAQAVLQQQLHTPGFVREYLAVVEGRPEPREQVIDAPIGKADGATLRREVRADGKESRTAMRVLLPGARSLVGLRLGSGRTHQIRVHMAYIGHPVTGDFLYGCEEECLPGRFALHSAYVSFVHPATGERLSFSCPLPEELTALLDAAPDPVFPLFPQFDQEALTQLP